MAMPNKEHYTTGQKALTRKQAESVIMAASSYEDKILVLIGFTLGLRRDDLVRIEVQNIDLNPSSPTLSYHERKKGNRIRTVPLTGELVHELSLYLKEHVKQDQKYLFPPRQRTHHSGCMSSKTAYNTFNALCKKAGVPSETGHIPIHAMRSTCIKLKQEEGWTIEQVAALIGDKVETVQEHYSTPSGGELAELMKTKPGI
jgi:integrase